MHRSHNKPLTSLTVDAENSETEIFGVSVSDIQSDVSISNGNATGTLKYLAAGNAITNKWGAGNFIALKFTASNWSNYTSVKVGLEPSASSGLVELITDPDKNGVFKVTNKDIQRFKVVAINGSGGEVIQYINLNGLTCENS